MQMELNTKFHRYEIAGIKQYWIVHPDLAIDLNDIFQILSEE